MGNQEEEREYEKAIKKGKFELECPYLEIIEIYETIKEKLAEKGWTDQTPLYSRQILALRNKLEKDRKLREVEAQKAQKQKNHRVYSRQQGAWQAKDLSLS